MKKPWVLALAAGVIVLLVALALPLWRMATGGGGGGGGGSGGGSGGASGGASGGGDAPGAAGASRGTGAASGLPWQVTLLQAADAGRAEVFGLVPGRDTLADAEALLQDRLQVALVARLGEVGVLEALVEPHVAGFVAGRLVLAFEADAGQRARWRDQASGSQPMQGGVRRFTLRSADHDEARRTRLVGMSFLPTMRLSEADVRQRFGPPAEVLAQPGGSQALLYPALGLVATVATTANSQRGVLQYVAPIDFAARLRAPLVASAPPVPAPATAAASVPATAPATAPATPATHAPAAAPAAPVKP